MKAAKLHPIWDKILRLRDCITWMASRRYENWSSINQLQICFDTTFIGYNVIWKITSLWKARIFSRLRKKINIVIKYRYSSLFWYYTQTLQDDNKRGLRKIESREIYRERATGYKHNKNQPLPSKLSFQYVDCFLYDVAKHVIKLSKSNSWI